jgi:TRAP-type C4-dicarboxylate transport system permease small subunit
VSDTRSGSPRPGAGRPAPGPGELLQQLAGHLAAGTRRVAMAALVLMTGLIVAEIGARDLFRASTLVADEMAGYLLVVVMAFGLSDSFRSGGFIRVELLDERLPLAARRGLEKVLLVVALGYTGFLAWRLWAFTVASYLEDTRSIDFSRTPLWIPRAVLAFGVTALALQIVASLVGPATPSGERR